MPIAPPGLVEALRSRRRDLKAEDAHIASLLALYGVPEDEGSSSDVPATQQASRRSQSERAKGSRKPRVSGQWRPIYDMMLRSGNDTHVDDLAEFSERNSLGYEREAIRNQMHNWKRQGLVTSPAPLVFRAINPEINNDAEPEASAPLSEIEGGGEPETSDVSRFDPLNHNTGNSPGGGT